MDIRGLSGAMESACRERSCGNTRARSIHPSDGTWAVRACPGMNHDEDRFTAVGRPSGREHPDPTRSVSFDWYAFGEEET